MADDAMAGADECRARDRGARHRTGTGAATGLNVRGRGEQSCGRASEKCPLRDSHAGGDEQEHAWPPHAPSLALGQDGAAAGGLRSGSCQRRRYAE